MEGLRSKVSELKNELATSQKFEALSLNLQHDLSDAKGQIQQLNDAAGVASAQASKLFRFCTADGVAGLGLALHNTCVRLAESCVEDDFFPLINDDAFTPEDTKNLQKSV